ncbi:MAG: nitroreductase family deazaflavin-dependent oxidoreductase [Actinomycetota bacterium]|nr:nitroreductase family deazaflavin-dependent oxidoreductase [Actinomycetota bacterium]
MAARYRLTPPRRFLNAALRLALPLGVGPSNTYLLTVPGRRTGRRYTTPVTLVDAGGERWLVAPYGERSWVKNARAAGSVELRRGRSRERFEVAELAPEERARILRAYVECVPLVEKFFDAKRGAPVEAFAAEAARHPVFRLGAERR